MIQAKYDDTMFNTMMIYDAFGMSSGCDKFLDMTEEDMSKHLG